MDVLAGEHAGLVAYIKEHANEVQVDTLSPRDAVSALILGHTIETFDRLIFPTAPCPIHFVLEKMPGRIAAYLRPGSRILPSSYVVFAADSAKQLDDYSGFAQRNLGRAFSYGGFFAGLAAHEVRHRVQEELRVRLFDGRYDYGELSEFVLSTREEMALMRQDMRKERVGRNVIRHRMRPREFDALVIEQIVAVYVSGEHTLSGIVHRLRLQPAGS